MPDLHLKLLREAELARIRRRRDLLNQSLRYWVERRTVTPWEKVEE